MKRFLLACCLATVGLIPFTCFTMADDLQDGIQ